MSGAGRPAHRADVGTAWYVYGIVSTANASAVGGGARGVSGAPVRVVVEGDLAAIVSEVPLREFDDEPLAANLHDPAWLSAGARDHDAVLSAVAQETSVVPFRFGTIYRSEEQVRAMLAEHVGLAATLDSIRGRIEVGVKGFVRRAEPPEEAAGGDNSPGRRYLEEKQRARRAAEERETLVARVADESHARLAAIAEEARANPLQPAEAAPRDSTMFLNGAYLVRLEDADAFREAVASLERELRESGVGYDLTGPWPPYNFVDVDA
jgi:hypothetical protein